MKNLFIIAALLFAAFKAQAGDFRFALLTDLHISANEIPTQDLERAVEQINNTEGLDFVLIAGDITEEGDRASLLQAKKSLDKLKLKYHITSGNHETKWTESGFTDFAHIFGSDKFSFEHQGFLFLGFNTGPLVRMADGHVLPQDIRWLKRELDIAGKERPVIIVTHYPLLDGDVDNWYEVTDLLRNYNVRAVLGGHYHGNKLMTYDGIPGIVNRSTLRAKEDVGGYSIYEISADSIVVSQQNIGGQPLRWGAYSLKTNYFNSDNTAYKRPDFSVNKEFSQVKETWMVQTGRGIYSSPVVYDKKVYVADGMGFITCFDLKNGKEIWAFESQNSIFGTPAAADKRIVFGSADKHIYCLDTQTGTLLWKYPCKEAILGAATIENGRVYIGGSDNSFRCIDLNKGSLIWEYTSIKGYIETRPLIYLDKVIFGAWDNQLYALNKADGSLLWQWNGGLSRMHFSPAAVWPVASEGKVFITAPDRVMTAIDASSGNTVWQTKQSVVRETIGLSEDGMRIYSKTMQDSVVAYTTKGNTHQQLWACNVGFGYEHAPSMPVEKSGVVFGSTKNGLVFAIKAASGKLLWKHKIGNSLTNTVVPLSNKTCIFTNAEGVVGRLDVK